MNDSALSASAAKRRAFFAIGEEYFQTFSISQNPSDASIYFSAPDFADIVWLVPTINPDAEPNLLTYQLRLDGKLSLHGSGIAHIRPFEQTNKNEFKIRGQALKNSSENTLGVRHLLTLFPAKPKHRPNSPALTRKSDGIFHFDRMQPYVILFWAVPTIDALEVEVSGSFHIDDLEEFPHRAGWGIFNMQAHSIVWFAYRTKHMQQWPKVTHACYYDGVHVPVLIGTSESTFRLELRQSIVTLKDNLLQIAT